MINYKDVKELNRLKKTLKKSTDDKKEQKKLNSYIKELLKSGTDTEKTISILKEMRDEGYLTQKDYEKQVKRFDNIYVFDDLGDLAKKKVKKIHDILRRKKVVK